MIFLSKFKHSVRLEIDKCKGCVNCIKHCPTQAIRVQNGKAKIIEAFCIDCAKCIRVCPHHAKVPVYDSLDVMKKYKHTVALPAPSLYAQFNNLKNIDIVLNALIALGFDDVFEVSGAAELVSDYSRLYLEKHEAETPFISTACPTVVRLIRVKFPSLIPRLLPIKPPVEVAAELARKLAVEKTGLKPEEIGIIFISPCPSKVTYAHTPLGVEKSEIDNVVAIKEVYPLLLPLMKNNTENLKPLSCSGRVGVGWGSSGGEIAALCTENYLAADGIDNILQVLEDLEDEKFDDLRFIELNSCSGGCVGGVLNVENPYISITKIKKINKHLPYSRSSIDDEIKIDFEWNEAVEFEPVFQLGQNFRESMARMNLVEQLTAELPGLDCGTCGAPTCRALAEDIARGEAQKTSCVYVLKDYVTKIRNDYRFLDNELKEWSENDES